MTAKTVIQTVLALLAIAVGLWGIYLGFRGDAYMTLAAGSALALYGISNCP